MKIGIEAQRLFRPNKHGMEVVAMELIRQLQALDQKTRYFIYAKPDSDDTCIPPAPNFTVRKVRSVTYADWEQVALPLAIRQNRPDFIHCTANTAPLIGQTPVLLTLHDIIFLEQLEFKGSAYQNVGNLYRRLVAPAAIGKARLIITVSEFEKQLIIKKCNVDDNRIRVIHNGVSDRFNSEYDLHRLIAFRRSYALPENFILYLGNTAPKKNARNVIRAYVEYIERNKDGLPIVVTDYESRYVKQTLAELDRLSLMNHFIFPGYVPPGDMPLMYNCASLFLYPSLRESFGLPLIEAMACGVPVITSNVSAMPEIAGDAAKTINPLDPSALAMAIEELLSGNDLLEAYRKRGFERARLFSWETAARKLLDVYADMYKKA